ncbi:hypothetical protein MICRO116_1020005 [Micrococcus sp. 116]|nr:hypothetical protein MICRO116_1020005 [Micrococcus sp. 116]
MSSASPGTDRPAPGLAPHRGSETPPRGAVGQRLAGELKHPTPGSGLPSVGEASAPSRG